MKISVSAILLLLWQITAVAETFPAPRILDAAMHHVRNAADQEWAEYKGAPESTSYLLEFDASASASEQTLRIVQHDVKQLWNIELNDKKLGRLHRDENAIVGFWTVPKSTLIGRSESTADFDHVEEQ